MKNPWSQLDSSEHAVQTALSISQFVTGCVAIVGLFLFLAREVDAGDLRAERVSAWNFQRDSDGNFDQKPDGWKRRQDRLHPAYIEMRLVSRSPETARVVKEAESTLAHWMRVWETGRWTHDYFAESSPAALADFFDLALLNNCLEVSMDGGAAELVSPVFPIENRFSYSMRVEQSCERLDGHTAWVELQLLDQSQQVIKVLSTPHMQGSMDWQTVASEISELVDTSLRWGRIHVKVEPHTSTVLAGVARFDSIHVYRMPRLSLSTDLKYHIARPGEEFQVECVATGIRESNSTVRFQLRNHLGSVLEQHSSKLEVSSSPPATTPQNTLLAQPATSKPRYVSVGGTSTDKNHSIDGRASWQFKLDEPGLYRVRVNLGTGLEQSQQREILLGIMQDPTSQTAGTFGWSLPPFNQRLTTQEVPELVHRFGAGWIKLSVWFAADDIASANNLVALIDHLQTMGTEIVGRLDNSPDLAISSNTGRERSYAVNNFRDPKDWEPQLVPVLTRIGMKIAWFQLGDDNDLSFVGKQDLAETLADLRSRMQNYSQELRLALSWSWMDNLPNNTAVPWNAVHFTNTPQLTAHELASYAGEHDGNTQLWTSIDPLMGEQYSLIHRIRDLTERMVAIKKAKVAAAFVTNPFRPELGLFTARKTLGEMLIPWHTLTSHIGSAVYMGSVELGGKSTNHIFANGEEGIMLVWSDSPATERTFLGERLAAIDVWGKPIEIENVTSERGTAEQQFRTSAWPILIRGIDLNLIRFRQQFDLELDTIDNSTAFAQKIPIVLENTLSQSTTGKVTIVCPSLLTGTPLESPIQLGKGLRQTKNIPVAIRTDASTGEHLLRFDFDLMADKPYHFSIHRTTSLGLGDVTLTWDVNRRDERLVVLRVEIENKSDEIVSFDCKVFPPGRAYERFRINDAKPGVSYQVIHLFLDQQSEEVETWLRCEQSGNGRLLNYRIKI